MDVELAEAAEEHGHDDTDQSKAPELAVSETTPEVLLLLRLVALSQAQLQSKQKKRISFPPLPVVRTARTAVRERRRRRHRDRVESLVEQAKARWRATHPDPSSSEAG